jgi:hypothetical protein
MARQAKCNNCGESAPLPQMLTVNVDNKTVTKICPECQRAKKIQITLARDKNGTWKYYQYFPIEA